MAGGIGTRVNLSQIFFLNPYSIKGKPMILNIMIILKNITLITLRHIKK